MKKYKLAVLIGRFEPSHKGHIANFIQGLQLADKIQILVGSSYQPRTPKNPFTFTERKEMISTDIQHLEMHGCFDIQAIKDYKYSNNSWISEIQKLVHELNPDINDNEIVILGYDKDSSSWYNHAFPMWKFISLNGFVEHGSVPIDATKIRELYFEGHLDYIKNTVTKSTFEYLTKFSKTTEYKWLVDEYNEYKNYKLKWANTPHPVIFHTVDAVVIQGGHVLLIRRKESPGKGLWALPGGFLNQNETLENACLRELVEETKIKVQEIILRKSITYEKCFDHPERSLRGRSITQAFLIELDGGDGSLPRVKGSDDAAIAKFFPISEIEKMEEYLFEDHAHIIKTMIARAKK